MAGVIINPRGTSGSGKTELVRRIMAEYGWSCGAERAPGAAIEPLELRGRSKPVGYRLRHPLGDRPLTVLGHYERTSGGCDTIRLADGGLQAAVRIAREHACAGSDVLIEGLRLSSEHRLSEELARMHRLHVICLATPLDQCVANLMKRRRVSRDSRLCIAARLEAERTAIDEACEKLMACAAVERLDFACALERIRGLVGLPGRLAPAGNRQHDCAHHG